VNAITESATAGSGCDAAVKGLDSRDGNHDGAGLDIRLLMHMLRKQASLRVPQFRACGSAASGFV
jgi:hypothetical protein